MLPDRDGQRFDARGFIHGYQPPMGIDLLEELCEWIERRDSLIPGNNLLAVFVSQYLPGFRVHRGSRLIY